MGEKTLLLELAVLVTVGVVFWCCTTGKWENCFTGTCRTGRSDGCYWQRSGSS